MSPVSPFQLAGDRQRVAFLRELLRGANASLAAARANLNRGTVYRWKLVDPEFAAVWAEIVANRPRRRHLRRRVLGQAPVLESSQSATSGTRGDPSRKTPWDNAWGPAFKARW